MFVGEHLKQIRLKRKKNLYNVSKETNISIFYLEAIENDEFDKIPGRAYIIGFIRTYADYLNLDSNKIVNEFKKQISLYDTSVPIEPPKPINVFYPLSFANKLFSLLVIVSLSIGFYFMFMDEYRFKPEYAVTTDIPENLISEIEEYEITTALNKIRETNRLKEYSKKSILEVELLKNNQSDIQQNQISAIASNPSLVDSVELENLISLKITNPTWIQLRDIDDNIVFSKLLEMNDVYNYSILRNYKITSGNAGNIIVSIGGNVMGKLGKQGEVIDSINILPDYFSN